MAWVLLGVGALLIVLTAVYVAAEFSLVTVDRAAVRQRAEAGDGAARRLRRGLSHLSTQLSGAQVGITVTTLALGYVMEPSLARLIGPLLAAIGMSPAAVTTVSVIIALVVATIASMVFGELVPKNLAIARPMAVARRVVRANMITTAICRPLIAVLNGSANGILRLIGITPTEELATARSAQELSAILQRSGDRGSIEQGSARLLVQTLRFSSKTADDVMTPRVDITAVHAADTADTIVATAAATGLSRFPVIGADIDDIRGLVHVKRAVRVPRNERGSVSAGSLMTPAPRVPGTLPLDDLMVRLRDRGLQMAIVADEYGGTAGLVTLEDAVEELVGEILDEHDTEDSRVRLDENGDAVISGALRPDEIDAALGLVLPEPEEYDTVAGLITEALERLPEAGDSVLIPAVLNATSPLRPTGHGADDEDADLPIAVTVRLTVVALDGRRVDLVRASVDSAGES